MAKLRELEKFLKDMGFIFLWQRGSHKRYERPDGSKFTVAIHPSKEIGKKLLADVLDEAGGYTLDDFYNS
jgi:predicted RNA binding protein YcfA (HicA-like mRNA interferase family)